MPVVLVFLAGLMMQSRGAIRLGMRITCRRTPTATGFRGYSLWTPDSRVCGYSVRIQCVRLHDRAIRRRFSPGSGKLDFVCMRPYLTLEWSVLLDTGVVYGQPSAGRWRHLDGSHLHDFLTGHKPG